MYKFYHVYNENYSKFKEPMIRRQEEIDRETADIERINRLIAFRNKTRDVFSKKQKNREWGNVKKHGGYNEIQVEFLPNPFLFSP